MNKEIEKQKGFTLVEMAIGMVIIGLLVSFAAVAFSSILNRNAEKKTFENMEVIADAISIYAQKHMRVPCPADPTGVAGATANGEPFGAEIRSGGAGSVSGLCNTIADAEGIIPFATLGIPQNLVKDKFGNYITYRVSVTSALRPSVAAGFPINSWCMTRPYWNQWFDDNYDGVLDATDNDNNIDAGEEFYVSRVKAAFCCGTWGAGATAGVAGDVDIQGSFNASLPNLSRGVGTGGDVLEYRTAVNAPPTRAELINPGIAGFADSTVPPLFPAYVLVSHGQNGDGAFSSETGIRNIAGIANPELENVNNDVTFFAPDRLASTAPGAGFTSLFRVNIDDIVFWATPSQVMGRIGGVSCSAP